MLNQRLQQKLLQKLSPQQIQLLKLLTIPTLALEQRIKEELEENPALEEGTEEEIPESDPEAKDADENDVNEDGEGQDNDFDLQEYLDDDYIPDYKLKANNASPDEETDQKDIPYASSMSFQDSLIVQLGERECSEKQYNIGLYIIGNIDDSGYLKREPEAMVDDLAFSLNVDTNKEEVMEVLKMIQEFDPPGIGGLDLKECLLIQLRRIENPNETIKTAILILEEQYEEFIRKHFENIVLYLQITEEQLRAAYNEIIKLNPKPGSSQSETTKTALYIIPDFIVTHSNGQLDIMLNSRNSPDLRVSRSYAAMLDDLAQGNKKLSASDKNLMQFVKQKVESARWFIEMINERQTTLYKTMKAIMDHQEEYFLTGDEAKMRPLRLKDIAAKINMDVSTVSRVANSKYVQTPYGTFLLKTFFADGMHMDSGEEVSTMEVKKILIECVTNEDKQNPVTDEQLMNILKEKGFSLARRTIAKYRETLDIPVARMRKEL
jgi:RNA polymerase sigma-54 factor